MLDEEADRRHTLEEEVRRGTQEQRQPQRSPLAAAGTGISLAGISLADELGELGAMSLAMPAPPSPAPVLEPGPSAEEAQEAAVLRWVELHLKQQAVMPSWAALKHDIVGQFPGYMVGRDKARYRNLDIILGPFPTEFPAPHHPTHAV